jgi:hypothetical protein
MREQLAGIARDAEVEPDLITDDQSYALHAMGVASQGVQTPLARVEHALLKPVAFGIVPLFALANAGVGLTSGGGAALTGPVMWGVLLGLLVGKPLGVLLASWAVVKSGLASLPEGASWRQIVGVAFLCGIGLHDVAVRGEPRVPRAAGATRGDEGGHHRRVGRLQRRRQPGPHSGEELETGIDVRSTLARRLGSGVRITGHRVPMATPTPWPKRSGLMPRRRSGHG